MTFGEFNTRKPLQKKKIKEEEEETDMGRETDLEIGRLYPGKAAAVQAATGQLR